MTEGIARNHQLHGLQPVLTVENVEIAARFFVEVLGFELDFLHGTPAIHGRVKSGDGSYGRPILVHIGLPSADEIGLKPTGELRIHVGHDVDGLCAIYKPRCAVVVQEPTDQPWGLREFVILGPNGHYLRLCAEVQFASAA